MDSFRFDGKTKIRILAVTVTVGLLMGVREEFASIWLRALLAGAAFGILGWFLYHQGMMSKE